MSFGWFVQKYAADRAGREVARESILKKRLFRYDEAAHVVDRRSTAIAMFKDDTYPEDPEHPENLPMLEKKIETKVKEAFNIFDSEQFYAMQLMGSQHGTIGFDEPDYLRMAFYLYLADEVSRSPNEKGYSLLAALRAVKFGALKPSTGGNYDANPTREELRDRFIKALGPDYLNLPHLEHVVQSWYNKNEFWFNGKVHKATHAQQGEKQGKFWGHYTELAKRICEGNDDIIMQMQDCVDYAYGNKVHVLKLSDDQLDKHTERMFYDYHRVRQNIIMNGETTRIKDLNEIARHRMPAPSKEEVDAWDEQRREHFLKLEPYLPLQVLQMINNTNTYVLQSSTSGIANIYPASDYEGRLPGLTKEECETAKLSKGLSLTRYDMMMVTHGMTRDGQPEFTEQQKLLRVANGYTHEFFHQISDWLINHKDKAVSDLYWDTMKCVDRLSAELKQQKDLQHQALAFKPMSMEGTSASEVTMRDVLDVNSQYYSDYYKYSDSDSESTQGYKSRKKSEEVCANVFSLLFTEMKLDAMPLKDNALYCEELQKIPALKELVDRMHKCMQVGLKLSQPQQEVALS